VATKLRDDVGGKLAPCICITRAVCNGRIDGRIDGRLDSLYDDDLSQELSGYFVTICKKKSVDCLDHDDNFEEL
jgi:hypothetical protein